MSRIRVKICCISSREEARTAIQTGADALGLVSSMPSGPGVISDEIIRDIAQIIPPPIASFLLTSKQDTAAIVTQQKFCRTNTIQICDHLTNGTYEDIRKALPGIAIVQVVHVTDESSINEAVRVSEFADAVLLDSGNQKLAVKELGGTGRKHDWRISARIRAAIKVPLFLAGGLNVENVREAIETVQPFGIDLCSSVRTDRKLDKTKLERLFEVVHRI